MRILFTTQILQSGIGIVRAKWPARWVNKFTEHTAECMDESDLLYSDMGSIVSQFDVVVIHKASYILSLVAKKAHELGVKVVYDTDDHDDALYDKYRILAYMQDVKTWRDEICSVADGITVTTQALARHLHPYGKPVAVIDNGYDVTLSQYKLNTAPYFEGFDGVWLKIICGGSMGHSRDIAMFLDMGVIEEFQNENIDWYFYGQLEGAPRERTVGKSTVKFLPGADISNYLQSFYSDASILIAPLVQDEFNDCRSLIKPVEAGLAGIPAVVSNVESYRNFSEGCQAVDNTKDRWCTALRALIYDKDMRETHGQHNRNAAYARHTADYLTQQRIEFYAGL